jgi:hypothetical protein
MCNSFWVISKRFNNTCLRALYMQRFELVRSLCKFWVVSLKEQVYWVWKGQFLVYCPNTSTATMRCHNGSHSELHLQKGTQQVRLPPRCQGFFHNHLATSDFSIWLASEVLHFNWDWDPLTFLPAGEIEEMRRTLKNLSALHLHHPDLIELQYLTCLHGAENASSLGLCWLDLGLHELTGSVSSYFASFSTGLGLMVMLILIALSYLNCRRSDAPTPLYPQATGPVIVQIPAPAPMAAPAPIPAPRARVTQQFLPGQTRKPRRRTQRSRGCCSHHQSSDDNFQIAYNTEQEELELISVQPISVQQLAGDQPRCHPLQPTSTKKGQRLWHWISQSLWTAGSLAIYANVRCSKIRKNRKRSWKSCEPFLHFINVY